ncbi:MAG: penicillin-binding protein 2 [Patescibacteria group bacterium]|nr:penicillin-binding protein 2 [Patescibacteria group bacterium]
MNSSIINRNYKNAKEIDEDFFYGNNLSTSESEPVLNTRKVGFLGKFLSNKKLNILLALIFVAMSILLFRAAYLQIYHGAYYGNLAENNRSREKPILAYRGVIYDSQGQPLIKNNPIFEALILPKDLSLNPAKRADQINAIAQILGLKSEDITGEIDKHPKNFKYMVPVLDDIDYQQALSLEIKSKSIVGLYIETRVERQYLYPYEFSHLIGYEGKLSDSEFSEKNSEGYLLNDYIGKTGLELSYESILRGTYGKDAVEVDAAGQEKKVISHQEAVNGENLTLTIDERVQKKAREVLSQHLRALGKKRGSLIMLNPNSGEVLALVSLPDYDPNLFANGISVDDYQKLEGDENQPLFDRSIKGEYPSGSTIKPVVAAAALQEGVITDKTTVMSTGGITVEDRWFFPDWSAAGHGLTNVYRAIAWSVNTFFYEIGGGYKDFKGLGIDNLEKYFKIFGLGEKTGIDLSGESSGLVPDPNWKKQTKNEDWYIGDTYHVSIGQGDLLATPIQIANYTAVFANGGILYQPHLVKEITPNGGQKAEIKPVILRENLVDEKNLEIVKKAMRQTVTDGSAPLLDSLSVSAAGKTGTAQWSTVKQPMAWFTGFAPYENPEVTITVLVEEGGEGSSACVPITYDMLNWYFGVYKNNRI